MVKRFVLANAGAPAAPIPAPKPLFNYAFEFQLNILGQEIHSFAPSGFFDHVGCNGVKGVCVHLPDEYGRRINDALKELKNASDGDHGDLVFCERDEEEDIFDIEVDIVVEVFDKSTGKFATLAETDIMATMTYLGSSSGGWPIQSDYDEGYPVIYNHSRHSHGADNHRPGYPNYGPRPRKPIFFTRTVVRFLDDRPCLGIFFTDDDDTDGFPNSEENEDQILGLMERLEWK